MRQYPNDPKGPTLSETRTRGADAGHAAATAADILTTSCTPPADVSRKGENSGLASAMILASAARSTSTSPSTTASDAYHLPRVSCGARVTSATSVVVTAPPPGSSRARKHPRVLTLNMTLRETGVPLKSKQRMDDVTVENRDLFAYMAVCWKLARLAPRGTPTLASFMNVRDADARVITVAAGAGSVDWGCGAGPLTYDVSAYDPVPTDTRADLYRSVRLRGERVTDFITAALVEYRADITARPAGSVARFAWNDDAGMWVRRGVQPSRPLSSVFLGGVQTDLFEDARRFLDPETTRMYVERHVAPVRVHLLHGVPGSGKSSLVTAVASELRRGVAVLNAAHDVAAAVRQLPPKCVVCIEDVDCAFRNSTASSPFADLLAALDSATEPTLIFLTTNDPQALDPALCRRIDNVVPFTYATREQCKAMYAWFLGTMDAFEDVWAHVQFRRFTTSTFQKFLVRVAADSADVPDAVDTCLPVFDLLADVADSAAKPDMYS